MKQNIEEANRSLTEKPLLATSAERFLILNEIKSLYKELPQPLRFSKMLSILLSRVSVPLQEYDLIIGRCVDRLLTDKEETEFKAYINHPDYPSRNIFFSSGHSTYSWEMLLKEGLTGLKERVLRQIESADSDDKRVFLSAILEIYDAIIAFILRYADVAQKNGMYDVALNLKKIATSRPDSFYSALQLLWTVTFIDCAYVSENPTLTLGRLDQMLYPFYKADIEKGVLTREKAKEYITDYYCKHNLIMGRGEHQVGNETNSTTFKRILNFDAPQYLLLAGTDERGELAVNELTELFAECIVPTFKNPVVVVRYVKDMDKKALPLWRTLCEKALESSSLMFYNDGNVINTLRRIGLPDEDARRYEHFGCNWCSPGDNSAWMASPPTSANYAIKRSPEESKTVDVPYMRTRSAHSWPEDFVEILRELSEKEDGSVCIDDFYNLFFDRMAKFIDHKLSVLSLELSLRKRRPSTVLTFGDCFFTDSINNAECFSAGAKYHFELQSFQMFGTVADCFIAVDQLVMIEKKLTLKRLLNATEANFKGYEDVLALCRNADKYGMDTPLSNKHARRLSHTASALVIEKNRPYFEKEKLFLVPCIQSDTWHLQYGEKYGATPDGRLAYTAYSQNSRPTNGVCSGGITAMLNSLLKLPHDGLTSGALNLDIDKKQYQGENGKGIFSAILASYFNQGGLHAQVSTSSLDELIDAKKNPHLHRDLRVRVTGYSGIFVDFCEKLQDDVIERWK
jgi:formate C-acetyltransferase